MALTGIRMRFSAEWSLSNTPPPPQENRAVYEIMWKNVQRGRPQMTIWRMRIARWIHKATNKHTEFVILISFPLRQWLRERASVLRYTYTACLFHMYPWYNVKKIVAYSDKVKFKPRCKVLWDVQSFHRQGLRDPRNHEDEGTRFRRNNRIY
jgi:hypothetical protein